MDGSNNTSGGLSSRSLPSLFSMSNGSSMATKDLEGLIAMNDSALSQQIEFILQDAPMEEHDDDDDDDHSGGGGGNTGVHHRILYQQQQQHQGSNDLMTSVKGQQLMDTESNSEGAISVVGTGPASVIKLETPPNSTTPITSASDLSQTSQDAAEQSMVKTITHHQQQQHITTTAVRQQQHHFLNGRGIIVRSSDIHDYNSLPLAASAAATVHDEEEEEDPELNDENLQDIEEEAKAAEADEEPPLLDGSQIKVEHMDEMVETVSAPRLTYTSGPTTVTTTNAEGQPTQLVLPAGSIVSTTTRSVTVPVSEALAHLQRRPVFISNGMANVGGTTLVRMPAMLSRNGSMAVLNVVQQQVGSGGQTTQLILQASPVCSVANSSNSTPMLVTTSPQASISGGELSGNSSPRTTAISSSNSNNNNNSAATSQILSNALAGNSPTIMAINTSPSNNNTATIVTTPAASTPTRSPPRSSSGHNNNNNGSSSAQQHPVASTSAQAQQQQQQQQQQIVATNYSRNTASTSPPSSTSSASPPSSTSTPSGTIYQCMECVEKFDNKELYEIHRSGHANNMKCAICNMVLKSLKNYEKHCLRCKPYECQICGRVVRFRPNFIKHMRVHTGQQSERHKYKCEVCHKEFMSFEYFKVHKKIHNENVNLTCEICGKQFSALASLRGHSKLHSGVKLHKCEVCGKGFGQRYNLKIHARTHTGDFPFECKICKKKLHTQSSLQTHMQVHQRVQTTSQATSTIKSTATSTTTSGNTSSSSSADSAHNSPTSTIVKMEPQSSSSSVIDNHPSTSSNLLLSQHSSSMHDDLDENSGLSDGLNSLNGHQYVSTSSLNNTMITATGEESSESSNTSQELRQTRQILLNGGTPTRAIVINNYMQSDKGVDTLLSQTSQPTQRIHAQVIRQNSSGGVGGGSGVIGGGSSSGGGVGASSSSALQQQLMRKTPIIHSTGGVTSLSGSVFNSSIQQRGSSPSPSPSSSSTSCSSSVVVSKSSGVPLSLASAVLGSSSIIRSTRDHDLNGHHHQHQQQQNQSQRNNHRNHHRRRHLADMDDDDDDTNLHHPTNGRHFDDDDDVMLDEKSSPSLATTAIKTEPNFYVSGDNSNEMLIKEEVVFHDDSSNHSPHSPPGSKFGMSNFDNDLDHHVDLSHALPTYGYLLDQHSIPDTIPAQLYADDDDFRLDHNSLGALHNNSSSTNDGDYIKKEWSYGTGSNYTINGKFDDDSNALCDAANFIYN
ncbi:DEP domain-containing protein DDB_G0279099 [Musca domestica]|uniref:DEP domain-containing protein DDB_G0279099 n=2 Tax=Musca domestica TaxID=7370 RepID=A0ABM3UX00_MUSDO|nr:DEP domain-containing protein DDB_G0279099 [Musca domestica]XP_058978057.1 DEP domain-containing protein DDB_G0279099 [Musca domestica]XP_058978058.1 DEP domain-containing protein DDB_G0279099 [Musca domestica]XP_058978059.1 DEP domain-containing protein DDB_G0279099 [Musca domestica]XP_058978060.1 DEP domain-containing protein DDB_G0279099 [Musca domestica]XP_058978061.1 DEP domain-containing protein DDB_G0279099 [Musca domestica]XP_058978062.1 DEP domain-containing protein DDB_G0279099 [